MCCGSIRGVHWSGFCIGLAIEGGFNAILDCSPVCRTGGFLFAWITIRNVDSRIRSNFRQLQERGDLPEKLQDVNIEEADMRDFNVKLPPNLEARLSLARFITGLWYILAPTVVGLCLGVAAIIGFFKRSI
jgi:hypothetical protein